MNIIATFILVTVVVVGVVFSKGKNIDTENVVGISNTADVVEKEIPTPDLTQSSSSTPQPTTINERKEADQDSGISEYKYPSSFVISSDPNSLVLESSDDSDKITDWYKDKIVREGLSVRTSVKTKTNGKVLNKLVGSDGEHKINVEVGKLSDSAIIRITVVLDI